MNKHHDLLKSVDNKIITVHFIEPVTQRDSIALLLTNDCDSVHLYIDKLTLEDRVSH